MLLSHIWRLDLGSLAVSGAQLTEKAPGEGPSQPPPARMAPGSSWLVAASLLSLCLHLHRVF